MVDLLVRNIEPDLRREIEHRAKSNRRSLSEEVKWLLRKGLTVEEKIRKLGTELAGLVPTEYRGDDIVFETFEPVAEPPDFK